MQRSSAWASAGLAVLLLAGPGWAQQGDEESRPDEWREGEDGREEGRGAEPDLDRPAEDPFEEMKRIVALMRGVEDRLFEADTGEFTREEQRRIVEALRFEDKTAQALEDLIRELEKKGGS